MENNIQEIAMDFMQRNDCNFFANGIILKIDIFGHKVEVETIWYSKREDKIYLHVGCSEFEGDLDIESLSDENQEKIIKTFKRHV